MAGEAVPYVVAVVDLKVEWSARESSIFRIDILEYPGGRMQAYKRADDIRVLGEPRGYAPDFLTASRAPHVPAVFSTKSQNGRLAWIAAFVDWIRSSWETWDWSGEERGPPAYSGTVILEYTTLVFDSAGNAEPLPPPVGEKQIVGYPGPASPPWRIFRSEDGEVYLSRKSAK